MFRDLPGSFEGFSQAIEGGPAPAGVRGASLRGVGDRRVRSLRASLSRGSFRVGRALGGASEFA
eukprot:6861922-Pyramimonas_sp.AAC.1